MDKLIEKIFYKAQSVRLEADEKASIKANVMSFMRSNTAPQMKASPYVNHFSLFAILSQKKYTMSLAVLLILVLTGGTSFAAAGALPGELLYSVKLNVNENVESLLAVSTQASAEVNAKHAVTRLKEAEVLATAGKLTPEVNDELEHNFTQSIDSLNKNTESLKESGDFNAIAKVSDNLEQGLNAHYALLEATSTVESENADAKMAAGTQATSQDQSASTSDEGTDTKIMMMAPMTLSAPAPTSTDEPQAKGKATVPQDEKTGALQELGNAENKIAEARALITASSTASTSTNTGNRSRTGGMAFARINMNGGISGLQAQARLTLANQYVVLGKAALNANQINQAVGFFKRAESATDDALSVYNNSSERMNTMQNDGHKTNDLMASTSEKGGVKNRKGDND
jgi:hypothetical protein